MNEFMDFIKMGLSIGIGYRVGSGIVNTIVKILKVLGEWCVEKVDESLKFDGEDSKSGQKSCTIEINGHEIDLNGFDKNKKADGD